MNTQVLNKMSSALTVQQYDSMERAARAMVPNRLIEAAAPAAFSEVGYPIRVQSENELWRYADCMHEGMTRSYFASLGSLSEWEFSGLAKIVETARFITLGYGHSVSPAAPVLRALMAYRALPEGAILEIGPGSGYLGAWAILDKRPYRSVEVSQAFHLWQSALFSALGGGDQINWWDWYLGKAAPVETIVCNNALNEFHLNALRFLVRVAEQAKVSIAVDGFGSTVLRTDRKTLSEFRGWTITKRPGICVLQSPGSSVPTFRAPTFRTRTWEDCAPIFGGALSDDEKFLAHCQERPSALRSALRRIKRAML